MEPRWSDAPGEIAGDEPARCRITVEGVVPESWSDRLGELRIRTASQHRSTLEGPIADPAALGGVLDTLCQLGLRIIELRTFPLHHGEDLADDE